MNTHCSRRRLGEGYPKQQSGNEIALEGLGVSKLQTATIANWAAIRANGFAGG